MFPDDAAPAQIAVIDTNVLIEFKKIVPVEQQWDQLVEMSARVAAGTLTFPRQVAKELSTVRFPDAPGAWIASSRNLVRHPEPTDDSLARVLAVAADLVEADNPTDVADPYVLAMALELFERHPDTRVVLVTNDVVDRMPVKISLRTACDRVGLLSCQAAAFRAWLVDAEAALVDEGGQSTFSTADPADPNSFTR